MDNELSAPTLTAPQNQLEKAALKVWGEAMTGDFYYQVGYELLGRAPNEDERRDIKTRLFAWMYGRKEPTE